MKKLIGFGIVLLCILFSEGFKPFAIAVKNIVVGVYEILKGFAVLIIKFPGESGLVDAAYTWMGYLLICVTFGAVGIYFTKHTKHKIWGIVSGIVSAISLLLTFSSSK